MSNPAETYESYMVPTLFAPWATRLVDVADPKAGERVLDVACGTGVVARTVARRVGRSGSVVGLDVNPTMLEVARDAAESESLDIEWMQGMAEELPFESGRFDLVTCQFALMFFTDRSTALREMRRVLARNGRIAIGVWQGIEQHPFYKTLDNVIQSRLAVSGVQEIFALGDAERLRMLLLEAGFADVEIIASSMTSRFPDPDGFLAGEIDVDTAAIPSMQSLDERARAEITEAIREDMAEPLRQMTDGDHVVLPFHALIVRARK